MNTKLMIFIGLCTLNVCTTKLVASSVTETYLKTEKEVGPDGDEKIEIRGTWSMTSESAITAKAGHNTVCLTFTQNIGHVNVSLYDGNGNLVYSGMVDTSAQRVVVIPAGNSEGRCTLVVENASGYAEGDFERKK